MRSRTWPPSRFSRYLAGCESLGLWVCCLRPKKVIENGITIVFVYWKRVTLLFVNSLVSVFLIFMCTCLCFCSHQMKTLMFGHFPERALYAPRTYGCVYLIHLTLLIHFGCIPPPNTNYHVLSHSLCISLSDRSFCRPTDEHVGVHGMRFQIHHIRSFLGSELTNSQGQSYMPGPAR